MKTLAWTLVCILFGAIGCASNLSPQVSETRQLVKDPQRPEWIGRPAVRDTDEHKAFVGLSNRQATEAQSREEARLSVYSQIIDQIGLFVERNIRQVISQTGLARDIISPAIVRDEITRMTGSGLVIGEPVQFYTEHWKTKKGYTPQEWYITYVLFYVPQDFLKNAQYEVLEKLKEGKSQTEQESLRRAQEIIKGMPIK